MRYLAAGAIAAVWSIYGFWPAVAVAFVGLIGYAMVMSWMAPPTRYTPATITRLPAQHERRWGWGLGVALTWFGPVPFITIRRRMR